jgi:hypothetical protein
MVENAGAEFEKDDHTYDVLKDFIRKYTPKAITDP